MKSYIILSIALLLLGATNSNAQNSPSIQQIENSLRKNGKYAMLVMKTQHLIAGIKTGKVLKSKSRKIDFQILVCGELVKEISVNKDLQKQIIDAVNINQIKILVCGLSIQQFGVDELLLPKEMLRTENGLIYMFGLQEQGFKTLIL
ncbi:secreted protein [Pseudopedobacter saltans DSM 12145]|uniref:Secreted protein n=1 Tax=Pseudopedobacter saltans (strain ATCC 51119 / DSM 12145 / JCM 21818 / CCUG 39354 / LMG 10337 / NBRC 100064 / NCIMB 13643) TaxID=762903 RepID=F0S7E1_PSESL|nr:hypothetical protein [Pseudopedobacter saltans]ADY51166.1 secreted protein [Pseudopedobacter saltans DSM 12145]